MSPMLAEPMTLDFDSIKLPDSIRALLSPEEAWAQRFTKLATLSTFAVDRRNEAVNGRKELGIEDIWTNFEEAYVGIDDVNRGQVGAPKWTKSPVMGGPLIAGTTRKKDGDDEDGAPEVASIFIRMSARYTDAATAKISEIILSPDEKSFSLTETPISSTLKDSNKQLVTTDGIPLERDAKPHEIPQQQTAAAQSPAGMLQEPAAGQAPTGEGPGMPLTESDVVEEAERKAHTAAERAEKRIHDQFVESKYNAEARKFLFDAARIGVGVMKGPFAILKRAKKYIKKQLKLGKSIFELQIDEKICPGVKRISPWDFFPDKFCGEDIHKGSQVWERDYIIEDELKDLKKLESQGYLPDQIDECIREGPQKSKVVEDRKAQEISALNDTSRYQIWYGQIRLTREDLLFLNSQEGLVFTDDELNDEEFLNEKVSVTLTLVNDRIIRAEKNMLDSGEFMYDTMPWQRREGSWAGVGIPEQLDGPQRMVNGATRAMLRNASNSAGSQHIVDTDLIEPVDGSWSAYGDKFWRRKKGATQIIEDVRQAFVSIGIPNVTDQLLKVIEYAFRLAEEVCNIPLISQGQSGPDQPKTLGGLEMQDSNANQLLRHIASVYDDNVTTNMVPRFYEWNMLDPDIPEDEKGDFQCHTQGSSALVERHIQNQMIGQIGGMVKDPAYGFDPRRWSRMWVKGQRLNPQDLMYSKPELKKIDSAPPPLPPQVMVAQVNAEARTKQLQMQLQHNLQVKQIDRELAIMKYANDNKMSMDKVKAELAKTTMTLQTQIELETNSKEHETAQVAVGGAEPRGRAPNGEAFTK